MNLRAGFEGKGQGWSGAQSERGAELRGWAPGGVGRSPSVISEVMGWRHISHQLLYLLPTYLRSRTKLHISYLPINPLNSLPSIVPMVRALLSLTSDMRRRAPNLSLAWAELSMNGLVLTHTSSLYETKRQHLNEQPFFFNAACAIETSLRPLELLRSLKEVERELSERTRKWKRFAPREIAIDIVAYGDLVMQSEELTIPHPKLIEHPSMLQPLQDIAPDYQHPLIKKTVAQLAEQFVEKSRSFRVLPFKMSDLFWRWGERTYVMGVLDVTTDSFSDNGPFPLEHEASERAVKLHRLARPHIIDVCGQFSRPGAPRLSARQELDRVYPVIRLLHKEVPEILLSVNTVYPEVAYACVKAGAHMVNDVSGGRLNNGLMLDTVAELNVPYILMHKYDGSVGDISTSLSLSVEAALCAGIDYHNLIVNPGVGFTETADQNLAMLKELPPTELPLLVDVSSKKSADGIICDPTIESRATVCASVAAGADVVRVHNVKAMTLVAKVADDIHRAKHDTSGAQPENVEVKDKAAATPQPAQAV